MRVIYWLRTWGWNSSLQTVIWSGRALVWRRELGELTCWGASGCFWFSAEHSISFTKRRVWMYNLRFAIISSDDRIKYLGQNHKSLVKQVSATDHKFQALCFKRTYFWGNRGGQASGGNKMWSLFWLLLLRISHFRSDLDWRADRVLAWFVADPGSITNTTNGPPNPNRNDPWVQNQK